MSILINIILITSSLFLLWRIKVVFDEAERKAKERNERYD